VGLVVFSRQWFAQAWQMGLVIVLSSVALVVQAVIVTGRWTLAGGAIVYLGLVTPSHKLNAGAH